MTIFRYWVLFNIEVMIMITIDNDYLINERGLDLRAHLKEYDNPSNMVEIFLKQLSHRVYDFIISNSVNFDTREQVDKWLQANPNRIDDFKRALAEQALYLIVNGDFTLLAPEPGDSYKEWLRKRISPATEYILSNLGFLRTTISDQEVYWNDPIFRKAYNRSTGNR